MDYLKQHQYPYNFQQGILWADEVENHVTSNKKLENKKQYKLQCNQNIFDILNNENDNDDDE